MTAAVGLWADLASSLDPVELARRCGVEPYPWQLAALRSRAPREAWVCSRQAGKSVAAALLAVYQAVYAPGSVTVMASPGQRQSSELYLKSKALYARLGRPAGARSEAATSLETEGGSRIVSLPGSSEATVRSFAADLLLIDEASRVGDDVLEALAPMVAITHGRVVMLSSPWSSEGGFWRAASGRDPGWTVRTVPAAEVPGIDPDFLARERLSMGPSAYAREYECSFAAMGAGLWSAAQLEALVDRRVRPLFPAGEAP